MGKENIVPLIIRLGTSVANKLIICQEELSRYFVTI